MVWEGDEPGIPGGTELTFGVPKPGDHSLQPPGIQREAAGYPAGIYAEAAPQGFAVRRRSAPSSELDPVWTNLETPRSVSPPFGVDTAERLVGAGGQRTLTHALRSDPSCISPPFGVDTAERLVGAGGQRTLTRALGSDPYGSAYSRGAEMVDEGYGPRPRSAAAALQALEGEHLQTPNLFRQGSASDAPNPFADVTPFPAVPRPLVTQASRDAGGPSNAHPNPFAAMRAVPSNAHQNPFAAARADPSKVQQPNPFAAARADPGMPSPLTSSTGASDSAHAFSRLFGVGRSVSVPEERSAIDREASLGQSGAGRGTPVVRDARATPHEVGIAGEEPAKGPVARPQGSITSVLDALDETASSGSFRRAGGEAGKGPSRVMGHAVSRGASGVLPETPSGFAGSGRGSSSTVLPWVLPLPAIPDPFADMAETGFTQVDAEDAEDACIPDPGPNITFRTSVTPARAGFGLFAPSISAPVPGTQPPQSVTAGTGGIARVPSLSSVSSPVAQMGADMGLSRVASSESGASGQSSDILSPFGEPAAPKSGASGPPSDMLSSFGEPTGAKAGLEILSPFEEMAEGGWFTPVDGDEAEEAGIGEPGPFVQQRLSGVARKTSGFTHRFSAAGATRVGLQARASWAGDRPQN